MPQRTQRFVVFGILIGVVGWGNVHAQPERPSVPLGALPGSPVPLGPELPVENAEFDRALAHCRARSADVTLAEAIGDCEAAVRIAESTFGQDAVEVGMAVVSLGRRLEDGQRYAEAEATYRRGLAMAERALGPHHPEVGSRLNDLAGVLRTVGRYDEADQIYLQATELLEHALGADHRLVAIQLNDRGLMLLEVGRYAESEVVLRKARTVMRAAVGPEHPEMVSVLNNLARLLHEIGRHGEAEPLFREAEAIVRSALGPDHPYLAAVLNNLGGVFKTSGRLADAETAYRQALAITEAAKGPDHPDVGTHLNNLAGVLSAQQRLREAERLYRQALAIAEAAYGPAHPIVGTDLNNIGEILLAQNRTGEAESTFARALAVTREALGEDHPSVGTLLNNLAITSRRRGRTDEAETRYREAVAIVESALGPQHPLVARSLLNLAAMLVAVGRHDDARVAFERTLAIEETDLELNLLAGTPRDRRAKLAQINLSTDLVVSWQLHEDPRAADLALETWLRRKGRLEAIERTVLGVERARADGEDALRETVNRYIELAGRRGPNRALDAELAAARKKLEGGFPAAQRILRRVELADVASALPARTRLVEIVTYRRFAFADSTWGPPRYAAYTLAPDGTVTWADLGAASLIDREVAALRLALMSQGSYEAAARALHAATIEPLGLDGADHVFLSTDGQLSLVPFSVLVEAGSGTDGPTVSYLGSGREGLPTSLEHPDPNRSLVVYDVDYADGPGPWAPLAFTRPEGRAVRRALRRADHLTGADATEANVTAVARPEVLHIASHGYFDAASPPSRASTGRGRRDVDPLSPGPQATSDNPMLRSGIVLAGANRSGEGLLTAGELAQVDLRGTALVTLSACSTGRGELRNGDGVYGLRRALALAGSRAQVLSLWSVDDEATAFLMSRFYGALRQGATVGDALGAAQAEVRAKPAWRHPTFWAAFTVSGDPSVTL